jgi:hypothetical protein
VVSHHQNFCIIFPPQFDGSSLLKQWLIIASELDGELMDPCIIPSRLNHGVVDSCFLPHRIPLAESKIFSPEALDLILSLPLTTTNLNLNATCDKVPIRGPIHDCLPRRLKDQFFDPEIVRGWGFLAVSDNYYWMNVPMFFAILGFDRASDHLGFVRAGLPFMTSRTVHKERERAWDEALYRVLCDTKHLKHGLNLATTIQFCDDQGFTWYSRSVLDECVGDEDDEGDRDSGSPPIRATRTITPLLFVFARKWDLVPIIELYIESLVEGVDEKIHIPKHYYIFPGWPMSSREKAANISRQKERVFI